MKVYVLDLKGQTMNLQALSALIRLYEGQVVRVMNVIVKD